MTLLAGDVGGTKTALALYDGSKVVRREVLPSARFGSLEALVREFLGPRHQIERACFGVAGPVSQDACRATNLPWVIEARGLEKDLGIPKVGLVNDFYALSIGLRELPESDFAALNSARPDPRGPWVVIGAGTGLGQAVLLKTADGFEVLASEGGHTDFGPRNELEIDLLRFLMLRFGHVSYERIVSGPGLLNIYEFLLERAVAREPATVREAIAGSPELAPAIISSRALEEPESLCAQALDLFVEIFGAEAGNLALKVVARGGVYVAGGIAPKILPKLLDGTFMKAFLDKGRLGHVLEATPVRVVLNAEAGLVGAAAIARRL
ncbi:MAG TPA: glucokinase [Myxococcales bacterium]|nr:glucokinase [Myxococcales bacterium]